MEERAEWEDVVVVRGCLVRGPDLEEGREGGREGGRREGKGGRKEGKGGREGRREGGSEEVKIIETR